MNKIKRFFGVLAIISAVIFMNGCKAEKGEVGPAGPAGPTGAIGATGATGATGTAGTANVLYSPWIDVTFAGSGTSYTGTISVPKLTQDIFDKGDIHVYMKDGTRILTIPYSQNISGTTYSIHPRYFVGSIGIVASYSLSTLPFRYILIPGGVPTGRRAAVDYSNYEEVKNYYNLPD